MEPQKNNTTKIIVIIVIVLIAGLVIYFMKKDTPAIPNDVATNEPVVKNDNDGTPTTTPTTPTNTPADTKQKYKDGTYTSTGEYVSPGGSEQVEVTLTLKADKVTDATVVAKAILPGSKNFQAKFISGFKALVIGKSIDEVKLDKVSGSSLTPKGFNDAVIKIQTQAKV